MANTPWTPDLRTVHTEQTQKIIDKFKKAFKKPEPKILYHYSKTENLKSILESNLLRASNITKLNDYSEYDYGLSLAKDLIKKRDYDPDFISLLLKEIDDYKDLSTNIFVLSLSVNEDSLSLWQWYSEENFSGYNIGFNYKDFDFSYSRCYGNIIYSGDEQKRILLELVDNFYAYYRRTKKMMADKLSLDFINKWHWDELINYFTLFKHSSFRCEEEYRVVYYIGPKEEYLVKEMNSNKPYIEIPICYNEEDRCDLPLWEIGIGPKNNISEYEVKSLFSKEKLENINRSKIPLK